MSAVHESSPLNKVGRTSCCFKKESVAVPRVSTSSELVSREHFAVQTEYNWLKHSMEVISKNELDKEEQLSWAAYHAFSCKTEVPCRNITQLMPLFYQEYIIKEGRESI